MLPFMGDGPPRELDPAHRPHLAPPRLARSRNRLRLSVGIGVTVFVIAVLASWLEYRHSFWYRDPQEQTQLMLNRLHEDIIRYRNEKQHWPATLDDLGPDAGGGHPGSPTWQDAWGQALIYDFRGEQPRVMSLGSDGKAGGTGYDHDLIGAVCVPPAATATLGDFLFQQPSLVMIETCLLTGGLASLLVLYLTRLPRRMPVAITQLVLCTGFAAFAAVVMSAVHIPTGYH